AAPPLPGPRKRAFRPPPGTPAPANSHHPAAPLSPARRAPPSGSRQSDRPEVVVLARRESGPHEASGLGPPALLDVRETVHVVRLPCHAPHVRGASPSPSPSPLVGVGHAVHQHLDLPAHEPRQTLGRDGALHLEQLLQP